MLAKYKMLRFILLRYISLCLPYPVSNDGSFSRLRLSLLFPVTYEACARD